MRPAGQKLPSPATWPALIPWHPPGTELTTCGESSVSHSYIRPDLDFDELMLANSAIVQEYIRTMDASGRFAGAVVSASVFLAYAITLAFILPLSPPISAPIQRPLPGVHR